MQESTLK